MFEEVAGKRKLAQEPLKIPLNQKGDDVSAGVHIKEEAKARGLGN